LKHLVDGFNRMVVNLKALFKKIYDEEENKKKAEIKALEFQLELLQSQINPHFIYNTLNTFSFFALKNGDEKLRELIQAFNSLLRASISVESSFVTIAKELDLTDKYLQIQESRYGNIFQIQYIVPEELLQYKIPKLILQPLVENAIFHGIAPKGSNGTIRIEFIQEDECIRVKIVDDGVGIDEKEIPQILNGRRKQEAKGFNNIGIVNIKERLKLYFGEQYDMKISSSLGFGTTIEFSIPLIGLE
jgi:two-component system, sensor histidine kinase YesM